MAHESEREFDLRKLLPGDFYCAGCAGRVCEVMTALDGVLEAECDLEGGTLTVRFEPKAISSADLEALVTRAVLDETGRVAHAAYRVTGLD